MDNNMIEYLGFVAAALTTCSFIPQAWKTIKTQDTSSISLLMYVLFVIGIILWLIYGVLMESKPMIYANVVTGILASIILLYKIKEVRSIKRTP